MTLNTSKSNDISLKKQMSTDQGKVKTKKSESG